jgi:hypothetical protein
MRMISVLINDEAPQLSYLPEARRRDAQRRFSCRISQRRVSIAGILLEPWRACDIPHIRAYLQPRANANIVVPKQPKSTSIEPVYRPAGLFAAWPQVPDEGNGSGYGALEPAFTYISSRWQL